MGKSRNPGTNQSGSFGSLSGRAIPYFDLSGYELDGKTPWVFEDGAIVWKLTRQFDPCSEACPFMNCPTRTQLKKGTSRTADFAHVQVGDTPQSLRITVPRWFLKSDPNDIELSPPLPHPGIDAAHHFSTEALEFVIRQLLDPDINIEDIAKSVGKTVRTINRIKDEFIPMPPWAVTLCINPAMECFRIDDVYIGKKKKRKGYTLLLDATHNSFIGLIPGTSAAAIGPALAAIRARCKIRSATMDFGDYVPIVKSWFPGITITGDKFHLIQKLRR